MRKTKRQHLFLSLALCLTLLASIFPLSGMAYAAAKEDGSDKSGGLNLSEVQVSTLYTNVGGGTAQWEYASGAAVLTLSGKGTIKATGGNHGIDLPDGTTLRVAKDASWTITGASGGSVKSGIWGKGSLTVEIAENASLTTTGGDNTARISSGNGLTANNTLTVTVVTTGSLTATGGKTEGTKGGNGIHGENIIINNNGTVRVTGGKNGETYNATGLLVLNGDMKVTGNGSLHCEGIYGIALMKSEGAVTIEGGTVVALGKKKCGISTSTSLTGGTLTVHVGATVLAVGSSGGVFGSVTGEGAVMQITAVSEFGNPDAKLDLSGVAEKTVYIYDKGMIGWDPTTEANAPAFTMTAQDQTDTSNAFYLRKGVQFPSDATKTIAVTLLANTGIEGDRGTSTPAINAGNSALTFTTPCAGDDGLRPQIHSGSEDIIASKVDFLGGSFKVYGKIAAPVALRAAAGRLEIEVEDVTPLPQGITITPPANHHSELRTRTNNSGEYRNLAGSPSNNGISYRGAESNYIAAIVAGTITPPSDSSGSSGPSTYAVVYKANYANAPVDVRDSGYRAGANVTLKAGSIFEAPEGKTFAGWAESASGAARYQGGESVKMPSGTLPLYAIWTDGGIIPSLNKIDHIAYIAGYPTGTVCPEGYITREETATIFYRLLDEETREAYETTRHLFPDVAAGRWSAQAIATLAKAGIVTGQSDGNFAPERSITRAEFAAIAARFDSDGYDGPDSFPDIAGHWAREQINRAAQKGWVSGTGSGRFEPDRPITRAEATVLINQVLERVPQTVDDLLPGMRTFTDNLDQTKWYYLAIQEAANGHDYTRKDDGVHETWTGLH